MQQIEYALRSAQIQRTTTTRGTNSTYTHSSLLPLDVNTSPYEKRRGRDRVVEHSHHEYWFAFLHPVIVLTLPDRIARYVCTNNRAPNGNKSRSRRWKRERGERREGEEGLLLEENQSSLRNRLSSEGDREYNKQEFKRRRQSRRRASKCCNSLRCTDLPFRKYTLEGGRFCRESSEKERHLNSYVLMIDEPRLGMENTKFFSPRLFTTREIPEGCLSFRVRRNV